MIDDSDRHRYAPWFFRTSFSNDYGSFTCDKCGCSFYHSPSEITLNGQTVYDCCCGYCTNEIIGDDWGKQPYE